MYAPHNTTVASRAGVWARWYPSRQARVRARSWTSRTTPGEGLPRRFRDTAEGAVRADKVCGAPIFSPATTRHRGTRLRIPPRPRVGEQPRRPRRRV